MKNWLSNKKEILSYLVFGVLTTVVSWSTYLLFTGVCRMPVFWANLLSWVCSVAFAYVTNKLFVFCSKSWQVGVVAKEAIGFVSSRAITGVLEIVGVPLLAGLGFDSLFYGLCTRMQLAWGVLYTQGIYSKMIFAVVIIVLNYIFSKLLVFRK